MRGKIQKINYIPGLEKKIAGIRQEKNEAIHNRQKTKWRD